MSEIPVLSSNTKLFIEVESTNSLLDKLFQLSQYLINFARVLKAQEVIRILEDPRFVEVRQKGLHKQLRHEDGRGTTVLFYKGRDISPRLLRQIASDIELTVEEFLESR